ncbi:hypothetical protein ZX61_15680 [Vibrio sp. VPAP30]|uniref:Uncharacterized protein n=1 Tax=Vibrio bivalvicida TaxID=1276888 RepID=A0A177XYD6_9VIBR|nr:hypothetical protein ZX61_15680 [Vibrio sp. VPAP30]OAJ93612.1 hypothetical protein APB76_13845 [Vibrio bivalvicida]
MSAPEWIKRIKIKWAIILSKHHQHCNRFPRQKLTNFLAFAANRQKLLIFRTVKANVWFYQIAKKSL